jgi:hypothetical protein
MTTQAQYRAVQRAIASRARHAAPAPALPGTRWANLVRAGYGLALLCVPGPMITAMTGQPASSRARAVARVLGARHVAQAAVCGLVPTRGLIQAGAAADSLHAASMLGLAGAEPGLRRALLADTAIEATLASVAVTALHR